MPTLHNSAKTSFSTSVDSAHPTIINDGARRPMRKALTSIAMKVAFPIPNSQFPAFQQNVSKASLTLSKNHPAG
ncbi:MAG: hypothetical protein AB1589_05270 [Cyanobacteriota bacterium]